MTTSGVKFTSMSALALILSLAAANAQDANPNAGTIDQVKFGDVWADMDVHVPEYTHEVGSASTAVGNTAAAQRKSGDVTAEISQSFDGSSRATNRLRGYSAGTAVATTTAYGNASSGGTNYGYNAYHAQQDAAGTIDAYTQVELLGGNEVAAATTSIANVSTTDNNFGNNYADQTQYSSAGVNSETDADMYANAYSATFATTAGGNAMSTNGYTSSNYNRALQKTETGSTIRGVTDTYITDGTNVTSATNSFGNSATVDNEWGYATLGLDGAETKQENGADVDAQSYLTLDNWSGYASSSAYGVGNSALVSNIGSDTAIYADQENTGTVTSQASFTGESWTGGAGVVTSTAIGNAATASVCNYCSDGAVGGRINQTNSGQVYATGSATTTYGGSVYGSATAVGNSATLQSTGD